jgi:hypothetical protein
VRQRIGIELDPVLENRRAAATDRADGDEEQEHRGLEDVQTDDLAQQVGWGDDQIESDHHQHDDDPVVVQAEQVHERPRPANA